MLKKMVNKFGKLITAAFFIIAIGIITFVLSIPLYGYFGIDTDIIGVLIVAIGLIVLDIGIIHRYELSGFKLDLMIIFAIVLSIPVLFLVIGLTYYLITGKPLG